MIRHGNALDVLRTMPEASVQMCVTSPPYYGLRDYGTGKWEGGSTDCDHKGPPFRTKATLNQNWGDGFSDVKNAADTQPMKDICGKCGALRVDEQIGLERTPELFIARLVEVFREVRRVLKPDGTCWVNMGDSYAGGGRARGKDRDAIYGHSKQGTNAGTNFLEAQPVPDGLKPKDLIGAPWMLAFALRADGWWLRQDIIWCKGSPMPESVRDRCTKAHEYIFLLSKAARYHYDIEAVKEPASKDSHARYARGRSDNHKYADGGPGGQTIARSFEHMRKPGVNPKATEPRSGIKQNSSFSHAVKDLVESRNLRSWWQLNSEPTSDAHFATFPIKLVERCVLAGSRPGDTVLDPFAGAGTTWLACLKHGRQFVGIELNAEYIEIANTRARKHYPLLVEAV